MIRGSVIVAFLAVAIACAAGIPQNIARDLADLQRDIRDARGADQVALGMSAEGSNKKGSKPKPAPTKKAKSASTTTSGKKTGGEDFSEFDLARMTLDTPITFEDEAEQDDPKARAILLKKLGIDKLKTDINDKGKFTIGKDPKKEDLPDPKPDKAGKKADAKKAAPKSGAKKAGSKTSALQVDGDFREDAHEVEDHERDHSAFRHFSEWLEGKQGHDQEGNDDTYHHIYHLKPGSSEWTHSRPEEVLLQNTAQRVSEHHTSGNIFYNAIYHTRQHFVPVDEMVDFLTPLTAANMVTLRTNGAGPACTGLKPPAVNANTYNRFCNAVKETYTKWTNVRDTACNAYDFAVAGAGPMGLMQAFYLWKCQARNLKVYEQRARLPRPNNVFRLQQPVFDVNIQNLLTSLGIAKAETYKMVMFDFELILSRHLESFGVDLQWAREVRAICYDNVSDRFKVWDDTRGAPAPGAATDSGTYCGAAPPGTAVSTNVNIVFGAEGVHSRVRDIAFNVNNGAAGNNFPAGVEYITGTIHSNGALANNRRAVFNTPPGGQVHGVNWGHDVSQDENRLPLKPAGNDQEIHALNIFISLQPTMTHQDGATTALCSATVPHPRTGRPYPRMGYLGMWAPELRRRLIRGNDAAAFDLLEKVTWLNPKVYKTAGANGEQVCWIELIVRHNFGRAFTNTHRAHMTHIKNPANAWDTNANFVTAIRGIMNSVIQGNAARTAWWNNYLGTAVSDNQFKANIQWVRTFQQTFRYVNRPIKSIPSANLITPPNPLPNPDPRLYIGLLGDTTRDSYYPFGYGLNAAEKEIWEDANNLVSKRDNQWLNIRAQVRNAVTASWLTSYCGMSVIHRDGVVTGVWTAKSDGTGHEERNWNDGDRRTLFERWGYQCHLPQAKVAY